MISTGLKYYENMKIERGLSMFKQKKSLPKSLSTDAVSPSA